MWRRNSLIPFFAIMSRKGFPRIFRSTILVFTLRPYFWSCCSKRISRELGQDKKIRSRTYSRLHMKEISAKGEKSISQRSASSAIWHSVPRFSSRRYQLGPPGEAKPVLPPISRCRAYMQPLPTHFSTDNIYFANEYEQAGKHKDRISRSRLIPNDQLRISRAQSK